MDRAVIKVSYQGFPCELHLEFLEQTNIPSSVIGWIDTLKERGFTAPVSYSKSGDDKIGKTGTVDGISKGEKTKTGNQMYIVNGKLEDGREFSWNEFTPTTFRKGDNFKVVKNDRGFLVGEIILPEGGDTDSIPF